MEERNTIRGKSTSLKIVTENASVRVVVQCARKTSGASRIKINVSSASKNTLVTRQSSRAPAANVRGGSLASKLKDVSSGSKCFFMIIVFQS